MHRNYRCNDFLCWDDVCAPTCIGASFCHKDVHHQDRRAGSDECCMSGCTSESSRKQVALNNSRDSLHTLQTTSFSDSLGTD